MLGRRVPSPLYAVGVLAAALVLTSCGGDDDPKPTGPTQDSGCGFHSGPFSDSVAVTGAFGGEVEVEFDEPFKPTGLERTILTPGSGKETKDGTAVNATVTVFNGRTGDQISTQTNKATVGDPGPEVIAAGLGCVPIGSRVVVAAPASDLFGTEGSPSVGLSGSDGIVIVTDVAAAVKAKATAWQDAPEVTFRGRRTPLVTAPTGPPPAGVLLDVIKPGTGQLVRAGNQVTVNFKTILWGSGKVVLETYGKGKKPLTYGTNDFVPGFTAAVVGQRAGAQLLVAVPPEFGYGAAGAESAGIGGTDTLLIVIEIQATADRPTS